MAKSNIKAVPAPAVKEKLDETQDTGPVVRKGMPAGFKMKRLVTLPALVMKKEGDCRVLKFIGEIHTSDVEGRKLPDGTREKPANVAHVVDQESGETLNFLVPTVVQSNLQKGYPDNGYVGLCFFIENMGKRKEGQRYTDFSIAEVDPE